MSIGATLAAARRRAGLTVGEVSQQTRVTEPIIEGIERDDYGACGGDFYARGHIRAIARAVGEDPEPLIEEYDSTWRSAQELTAAEAFGPTLPARTRERRRVRWAAVLAVLVLAVLGFAGYKFVSGAQHKTAASARSAPPAGQAGRGGGTAPTQFGTAQSGTGQSGAATSAPASTPAGTPSPSSTGQASPPARVLAPASVAAFGPTGTADGDNPQLAAQAVAGNPAVPWYSQWYATPQFGLLKKGTGLLLDMGRTVTVSSVSLSLVNRSGADLELRAGAGPVPSRLSRVAAASDAGGTVRLRLSTPAHVRYLLVWFTLLPPDNAGTYQVSVYKITVTGQP